MIYAKNVDVADTESNETSIKTSQGGIYENKVDLDLVVCDTGLRSHKESAATIGVVEPIPGDWEIVKTTHDYRKPEAHTVQFDVPVEKNGEVKLQYRVRVRF